MRPSLCSRCGAVLPVPVVGASGRAEGACPECGLGFAMAAMTLGSPQEAAARRPVEEVLEEHRRRGLAAVRDRAFPLYGLDVGWTGRRSLGGWGTGGRRVTHVELAHDDEGRSVRVRTEIGPAPGLPASPALAARNLAQHLWHEGAAPHTPPLRAPFAGDDPTAGWAGTTIPVDGEPVAFRVHPADGLWGAVAAVGDVVVSILGRGVAPDAIRLVTIDDVRPYLDGGPPI